MVAVSSFAARSTFLSDIVTPEEKLFGKTCNGIPWWDAERQAHCFSMFS